MDEALNNETYQQYPISLQMNKEEITHFQFIDKNGQLKKPTLNFSCVQRSLPADRSFENKTISGLAPSTVSTKRMGRKARSQWLDCFLSGFSASAPANLISLSITDQSITPRSKLDQGQEYVIKKAADIYTTANHSVENNISIYIRNQYQELTDDIKVFIQNISCRNPY